MGGSKPDAAAESLPADCPNCGAPLGGKGRFCSMCGQDCGNLGLQTRAMVSDAAQQILGWDGALPRTLRGLAVNPGGLVLDFAQGRRRSYLNPARFCFVSLALWVLTIKGLGFDLIEHSGVRVDGSPQASRKAIQELRGIVSQNFNWLLLAALPLRAMWLRLLFRKAPKTVAACLVLVLYVSGFAFLVGVPLTVLEKLGVTGADRIRPVIGLVWTVRAARTFFDMPWGTTTWRVLVVTVLHVVSTTAVVGLLLLPWLLLR